MTDLITLSDAEIEAVAGGVTTQSITIHAMQTNTSAVTQTATATNSGAVTATASGTLSTAAAVGAAANNVALVSQTNAVLALNSIR